MTFSTLALGAAPARFIARPFWRDYAVTMRPYLLFVSGITGLAGLALAPAVGVAVTALLFVGFFLSYGFGQALTDCFQTDTDALSAPYRPLVRGALRRRDVLVVSLLGLAACGVIVTAFQPLNIPLAALTVLGLATYTPFKRRWWGGPFYNAWIVGVVCVLGYLAGVGAGDGVPRWSAGMEWTLAAVFFGYANFVLAGYFKDVRADRATGYRTLPVVFGLAVSAIVSDLFAFVALVASAAAIAAAPAVAAAPASRVAPLLLLGGAVVATLMAQARLHRVRRDEDAHRAIAPVVHAYLLALAAVAAAYRPGWAPALGLLYAGFLLTMARRPMQAQI